MQLNQPPIAKTGMLIRAPVHQCFEAFVDPTITSNFWFTQGSARLDAATQVRWEWKMYGFGVDVTVLAIEPDKRILVEWTGYGAPTPIEWLFTARPDNTTFIDITNQGFSGDADKMVQEAISSTEGFTFVLAGAKAYLEHNLRLNLIADRFPEGNIPPA